MTPASFAFQPTKAVLRSVQDAFEVSAPWYRKPLGPEIAGKVVGEDMRTPPLKGTAAYRVAFSDAALPIAFSASVGHTPDSHVIFVLELFLVGKR
jgi:hypothetical protein